MATKALMNGTGWFQVICNNGKQVQLKLKPMTEKMWFEATWNGQILFQTRGKKDAVAQFNREINHAKEAVGLL